MIRDNIKDPNLLDPIVRQQLIELIKRDIRNIGYIYRSMGNALYDEPITRLAERVVDTIEHEFPVLLSKTDQPRADEKILNNEELQAIENAKLVFENDGGGSFDCMGHP